MDIKRVLRFQSKGLCKFLQSRVMLGVIFGSVGVMAIAIGMNLVEKDRILKECSESMQRLALGAKKTALLRKKERARLEQYASADREYVEKYLEEFVPLHGEIAKLEMLLGHESFKNCRALNERIGVLRDRNRLAFRIEKRDETKEIVESELVQTDSVEVGGDDVKKVLARVEGVKVDGMASPSNRPELVVKEFHLKRVEEGRFGLKMSLIKREGVEK